MLNGALMIEVVNNSFEKLWSFDKAWNVLIKKIEILVVKNVSPVNFAKYLSYSEVQKSRNVLFW